MSFENLNLKEYILNASGSLRQDYLNTCAATAINQNILSCLPNISTLETIAQDVLNYIKSFLNDIKYNKIENYELNINDKAWKGVRAPTIK